MIVPSMTVKDIHKEVFEDLENLKYKMDECHNEFKKVVLRSSRYPVTRSYEFKTREKRNLFFVDFTALKRSDWKKNILTIYAIYSRPEGMYAVVPKIDMNLISIHPPHFFTRYRERILKDDSLSNLDVIKKYFKNSWGFTVAVVNQDFETVYHRFENGGKNDKVSFVGATSEGYCFGEKQGNVHIIKTIISEDMLFENQKFVFSELKKAFIKDNKDRYGTDVAFSGYK